MKRFIMILIMLFMVSSDILAQSANINVRRFPVTAGVDTVITYYADAYGSDDHALSIAMDTTSGRAFSLGIMPTYTFTVQQVMRARSGNDSTFVLFNNQSTAGAQTISSSAVPSDSARVWSISPTVIPAFSLKFIITYTGMSAGSRYNAYIGYIGRHNRE